MTLLWLLLGSAALAAEPVEVDLEPATDAHGIGVGAQIGEGTGLVVQYRPRDEDWGAQAGLTWSTVGGFGQLHADYLLRPYTLKTDSVPTMRLPFLVGVGVQADLGYARRAGRGSPVGMSVRAPIQLSFTDTEVPADGYIEVAPVLVVAPYLGFDFDASLGVRVFF